MDVLSVLTKKGMEARALYDFRAMQEDELSFRAQEILKILQLDDVSKNIAFF